MEIHSTGNAPRFGECDGSFLGVLLFLFSKLLLGVCPAIPFPAGHEPEEYVNELKARNFAQEVSQQTERLFVARRRGGGREV